MNRSLQNFLLLTAVPASLAGLLLMSGCSEEVGALSSDFPSVYERSMVSCGNCHYPGAPSSRSNVDASSESALYNSLVNVTVQSPSNPSQCQTVRRVQAGQPEASYLLGVLSAGYNKNNFAGVSGCQPNVAHLENFNFSSEEIQAIVSWISNGANRN